jgi:hypothetical protein
MSCFRGFAFKFVVSSIFKKNDTCGCGFIDARGLACGLEPVPIADGELLPTCDQHAPLYAEATDIVVMEPSGDNAKGKFHWEIFEKSKGMEHYKNG